LDIESTQSFNHSTSTNAGKTNDTTDNTIDLADLYRSDPVQEQKHFRTGKKEIKSNHPWIGNIICSTPMGRILEPFILYAMIHFMIDIETLSTYSDAVILSIGLVTFNEKEILKKESWNLNINNQILTRRIDRDTIKFWQDKEDQFMKTRKKTFGLRFVLQQIQFTINVESEGKEFKVWAKSPDFDLDILANAYKQYQEKTPWEYWNKMDVRTIYTLMKMKGIEKSKNINHHNALSDAESQAKDVIKYFGSVGIC
jgi:hypothetical protein